VCLWLLNEYKKYIFIIIRIRFNSFAFFLPFLSRSVGDKRNFFWGIIICGYLQVVATAFLKKW
jgi:hypothetical protein